MDGMSVELIQCRVLPLGRGPSLSKGPGFSVSPVWEEVINVGVADDRVQRKRLMLSFTFPLKEMI